MLSVSIYFHLWFKALKAINNLLSKITHVHKEIRQPEQESAEKIIRSRFSKFLNLLLIFGVTSHRLLK